MMDSQVRVPRYPCHIIALAKYLAHLESATLLQSSPSPCLLPSRFLFLSQRLSGDSCCARSASLRTMASPAAVRRGGVLAGSGEGEAPPTALVPLTRVCAQVAKGPRQENQAVQHLFFPFARSTPSSGSSS